jgi:hypothetical protein
VSCAFFARRFILPSSVDCQRTDGARCRDGKWNEKYSVKRAAEGEMSPKPIVDAADEKKNQYVSNTIGFFTGDSIQNERQLAYTTLHPL